jgi:Na+-transporting NADH:ubiquinone oxidoreductase subunit NqrC
VKSNIYIVIVSFIAGVLLCYFVMPSKEVTKEVESKEQAKKIAELESRIKANVVTYRTIYKDRIVEKIIDKSVTEKKEKEDLVTQKTSQVEETTKINTKKIGLEAGMNVNHTYYGHVTYDLFGNFFIGGHIEIGLHNTLGAGIGVRL